MPYWPLCRTSPPFPQNPSRRFLREGAAAAGRPCISGTYLPHALLCISGTYLPHALLHAGDTPSTRMFEQAPCLRRHNRGSQTIPVRFARETLINSFRAGRPRGGRLRAQAASAQLHCAFLAFARIRLATGPTAAKAIDQCFPMRSRCGLVSGRVPRRERGPRAASRTRRRGRCSRNSAAADMSRSCRRRSPDDVPGRRRPQAGRS